MTATRQRLDLAQCLDDHEAVDAVLYPGLESHPQHDLAREQMHGFGGVLSFELAGDGSTRTGLDARETVTLADSLGGVESLAELPAAMTHEPLSPAARDGSASLIRSSAFQSVSRMSRTSGRIWSAVRGA